MEKGLIFTGARARLLANGVKVGWARNVNGREMISYERAKVLDNIRTQEHAPVDYDVSFSCGLIRIVGKSVKALGLFPSNGLTPQDHLTNILTNGELTLSIEDNQSGLVLATLIQARFSSNNWSIDAAGIVGVDMDGVAIQFKDESEV